MAQESIVLSNARETLVRHCHMVAGRLAEGWKPWSSHDVEVLVQCGDAITVLDSLIKLEAAMDCVKTTVAPEFLDPLSEEPTSLVSA